MDDALKRLVEAVEAGGWLSVGTVEAAIPKWGTLVLAAYDDDLTTAKALHEAVMPGWGFTCGTALPDKFFAKVWGPFTGRHSIETPRPTAIADRLTRAWLLAILRALQETRP